MESVNQILVAVDASAMAQEVLKRAILVAGEKGANLLVLHVIEVPFVEFPFAESIDKEALRSRIESQVERLNAQANVECSVLLLQGRASDIVTVEAKKVKADLIVIGSHGKEDIQSGYFGSTVRKIIQQTHIPVLLVKNRADGPYRRMIAPTNFTDYSEKSILYAKALFGTTPLVCLNAFETISEIQAEFYRINEEERDRLRHKMATSAKADMDKLAKRVGSEETALIDMSASLNDDLLAYITEDRADLVVLGSKGVDNMNSFIYGSTASYLSQRSPVDVLIYVP